MDSCSLFSSKYFTRQLKYFRNLAKITFDIFM